ncbi:hypothetical protein AMK23_35130 [Streptomyces sp. CB02130]|uniref:hypothetical protein n=1 Tax=Streptomyces sp. CB02130 TaxID=1703934 RepID=UPI000939E070|nr:hypothetical protein [Streptomyces sp. CB02130]OKJ18851.1 hypothetical protein AMK23_35130 [Streptomyces sp. CB02130]
MSEILIPDTTMAEHQAALAGAYRYFEGVDLGGTPPDPNIADGDGLISYVNAATNPPPPALVEEQDKVSSVLEGLTGLVTAAVLANAAKPGNKGKHDPEAWSEPIRKGLGPFISGVNSETVTYNRDVAGVEVANQFLNILMSAVTRESPALDSFRKFLQGQGQTIRLQGESKEEGYQYACIGMVHEIFQTPEQRWIYVPKIRCYFTSFTRSSFKVTSGCASASKYNFNFRVEKFVAPFKIQTWRDQEWFRTDVDTFIQGHTRAAIEQSDNYFDDIFESTEA